MAKKESRWLITTDIEIPFHDVDMMNIAWHGNYAKYFEIARCVLLDSIDYNYIQMKASGFAWPVIDFQARYIQPLVFQQTISIEASITEYEHRLKINYIIRDKETGKRLTKGFTSQVAVNMQTQELCLASPKILYSKLGIEHEFCS